MSADTGSEFHVTYDSGDAKLQLRCMLYVLKKRGSLLSIAALSVLACVVMPFIGLLIAPALVLMQVWATASWRARRPRICTTTLDELGVHDLTPDSNKSYSWQKIKKVEMCERDIYFLTCSGGVFVPSSAFPDQQSAAAFFTSANALRERNRFVNAGTLKMNQQITLGDDLHDHDEAEWLELEKRHKQLKPAE